MTSPTPNLLRLDPNFHEPGRTFFRDFSPGDDFYKP